MVPSKIEIDFLDDYNGQIDAIIEYYISPKLRRNRNSVKYKDLMHDLLLQYFGEDVLIPYDLEERKRKFPQVFHDLQKYMI